MMISNRGFKDLFQSSGLDLSSVGLLLNQILLPCLLINAKNGVILQVNSDLLEMTAFSRDEILNQPIEYLIKGWNKLFFDEETAVAKIINKSSVLQEKVINRIKLDDKENWLLLINETKPIKNIQDNEIFILNLINNLIEWSPDITTENYLNQIHEPIMKIFSAEELGVYLSNPKEEGELIKLNSCSWYKLPIAIQDADLLNIEKIDIWKSGRRILNSLHRFARKENLICMIQVPLMINQSHRGLLVLINPVINDGEKGIIWIERIITIIESNLFRIQNQIVQNQISQENKHDVQIGKELIKYINIGVVITNHDRIILHANPEIEKIFGFKEWEIKNKTIDHLIISDDQEVNDIVTDSIMKESVNQYITHLFRRTGELFPAIISIIPVMNKSIQKSGKLLLFLITDKSEDERIKDQKEQLERQAILGSMIKEFAHDVRVPVSSISTGIQTLELITKDDDSINKIIDAAKNDCMRIDQLMESVLSYSRFLVAKLKPIVVNDWINRIIERWKMKFEKLGADIRFISNGENLQVMGDSRSLEQVLNNLISNALSVITPHKGVVAISTQLIQEGDNPPFVDVLVTDNGPGIPEEMLDKIFEPDYSTNEHGTGLGLAISRKIITAHHGEIFAKSFPGGSIFTVRLPAYIGESK